jgi:hypothetical protein
MGARAVEAMDAGCIGYENQIGAADEKPVFHHADDAPDALLEPRRVVDATKIAIKNAVAVIGNKGTARRGADASTGAEHFE